MSATSCPEYGDHNMLWRLILHHCPNQPRCYYCGAEFSPTVEGWSFMSIDHFQPVSAAGSGEFDNLRLSCRQCNSRKRARCFGKGDSEAEDFSSRQKLMLRRDNEWVKGRFQWLRELGNLSRLSYLDSLGEALLPEIRSALQDKDARFARSPKWIQFQRKHGTWYFEYNEFLLQPHFVHAADRRFGQGVDPLEELYYFRGPEMRCKYLPPFIDAKKGAEIIKAEVLRVEEVWDEMQRDKDENSR